MTTHLWPNTAPGTRTDWIEFTIEDEDGTDNVQRFRINASFMLSRWNCHFGTCPGILTMAANTDLGCCQHGVSIAEGEDFEQVKNAISQLTPEDSDMHHMRYDGDEAPGLYRIDPDGDGYQYHTKLNDGACVFANRTGGPAGKPGCAFHHLALRTGQDPSDTKPQICWQIPFDVREEWNNADMVWDTVVTNRNGAGWGSEVYGDTPELKMFPGYWCTETPDAYHGAELVYIANEVVLRKAMGDAAYERMADLLGEVDRRYPMSGEVTNEGRPMLPLLVRERVSMWVQNGDVDPLRRSTYLKGEGSSQGVE